LTCDASITLLGLIGEQYDHYYRTVGRDAPRASTMRKAAVGLRRVRPGAERRIHPARRAA